MRLDVANLSRREMAGRVVAELGISVRLACQIFSVSPLLPVRGQEERRERENCGLAAAVD